MNNEEQKAKNKNVRVLRTNYVVITSHTSLKGVIPLIPIRFSS